MCTLVWSEDFFPGVQQTVHARRRCDRKKNDRKALSYCTDKGGYGLMLRPIYNQVCRGLKEGDFLISVRNPLSHVRR